MAPKEWELKRASGSAYYILLICQLDERYFLVQQSGKMGAKYRRVPQFPGLPIASIDGYATIQEAYRQGEKEVSAKIRQKEHRHYIHLASHERYAFCDKEGRGAIELVHLEEVNVG